jgi:hypothetical protein
MKTSSPVKSVVAENGNGWTVQHRSERAVRRRDYCDANPRCRCDAAERRSEPDARTERYQVQFIGHRHALAMTKECAVRCLRASDSLCRAARAAVCSQPRLFTINFLIAHRKIAPSIRCFLGGSRDEQILQSSEAEILQIVRDELRQMIALTAEPLFARVYKWKSAMAQYSVGHLERLQRIESIRQQLPGLALAGNGYSGIGVPDCVRSGAEAAGKILTAIKIGQSV